MASSYAVGVAAFFQIILRVSFFIEQRNDMCSPAPTLASWVFLIAFLDLILDICVYPVRYMHLPYTCQFLVETVVTVLLTEFGTLVVWCTIENITYQLCKSMLLLLGTPPGLYYAWERYILGIATTSTSVLILWLTVKATDHFHYMQKRSLRMGRKLSTKFWETCSKLRSQVVSHKCVNDATDLNTNLNTDLICLARGNNTRRNRSRIRGSRSRSRNPNRNNRYS